jgi:hypothetical protein
MPKINWHETERVLKTAGKVVGGPVVVVGAIKATAAHRSAEQRGLGDRPPGDDVLRTGSRNGEDPPERALLVDWPPLVSSPGERRCQ